jgi:hypothetical protein
MANQKFYVPQSDYLLKTELLFQLGLTHAIDPALPTDYAAQWK